MKKKKFMLLNADFKVSMSLWLSGESLLSQLSMIVRVEFRVIKLPQLSIMHDCVELFASISPLRNVSRAETFLIYECYLSRYVLHKI